MCKVSRINSSPAKRKECSPFSYCIKLRFYVKHVANVKVAALSFWIRLFSGIIFRFSLLVVM